MTDANTTKLEKILDGKPELICHFCIHEFECDGGVKGGPNGPIYPRCVDLSTDDFIDEFIDEEAVEDYEFDAPDEQKEKKECAHLKK